jgi:transposase
MARGQEDSIKILLGLKGYKVEEAREDEDRVVIKVTVVAKQINCPYCGSINLYRHGICKPREILHSWSNGRRVYLELHRHRWRCHNCGHTFNEGNELVQPHSRLTRQAEQEALWQLKERSFSQVKRELRIGYSTLRRLLEKEVDGECLAFIDKEDEIFLGIDEHSFKHQELVHTVTEVKKRRMLGILSDDRVVTLKRFLSKIPKDKVREVCIDMKEALRKVAEGMFPQAKIVVDPFHIVADANRRVDEARRIEQDVNFKRRIKIPKRIFLVGRERLSEEAKQKVDKLLDKYPGLKGFYSAKEKIRELYRRETREEAAMLLDLIIVNLKSEDDGELVRWGNTLKRWREPILNHFNNGTTNGFTEGCNTKIKMLKRVSFGLKNVEVYWRKMLLGFTPSRSCFHNI